MKIVAERITLGELKQMAQAGFGTLVKAVVDVATGVMAVDAELHGDQPVPGSPTQPHCGRDDETNPAEGRGKPVCPHFHELRIKVALQGAD